jgi:hypothetical protein
MAMTDTTTTKRGRFLGAALTGLVAIGFAAPNAGAVIGPKSHRRCVQSVAEAGGAYVKKRMRASARCVDGSLRRPGACDAAALAPRLHKAESRLRAKIETRCGLSHLAFRLIGYPNVCPDPDLSDGFTVSDLVACILDSHGAKSDELLRLVYGSAYPGPASPLGDRAVLSCVRAISHRGRGFLQAALKQMQRCRNLINEGGLAGVDPAACEGIEPFRGRIDRAESRARAGILARCTADHVAALDLDPDGVCDGGFVIQADGRAIADPGAAAACVLDEHRRAARRLIDIEYPSGVSPFCGDGFVNDPLAAVLTGGPKLGPPPEECDPPDDGACPGRCGAPDGDFPCLCLDRPRQRVIDHDNADLDLGWTGRMHDQRVVEAGYLVDLYDCDGTTALGGTDPECTVGPSCALAPNPPCASDADCPGAGDFCRKRATAVGPHCNGDVQKACTSDADCPPAGIDFCRKTPYGPPLPLSAGGVAACVVKIFSEDITGTTDLDTGAAEMRVRQSWLTHLGIGTINQPCPTCGGFCEGSAGTGDAGPGTRTLCESDADCPPGVHCVTDRVCSYGPSIDRPCRPDPPFGAATAFFGTPSQDCPPSPDSNISGAGLDILLDPAVTESVTLIPDHPCPAASGFDFKTCVAGPDAGKRCCGGLGVCTGGTCAGGPDDGRPCQADCPGACHEQCFCPSAPSSGVVQKPNDCFPACVGGANDAQPCASDADCDPPGGFCHAGDCPVNPADTDSNQEGACTAGPVDGVCSLTPIETCVVDADCAAPACAFCRVGETCVFQPRQCFVNGGIVRDGAPGVPARVSAATFCLAGTASAAVNATAGLAGPGALFQPQTVVSTGVLD